ncbi:uncharacterized protein [Antedon mediterranea]|uniref:uncharacterized protein n=1 Tax=Antedon mediterranea TaxID=105859 RepID=UPI003AF4F330
MFVKILFVGLIVGVEFSSTSRIGKWMPLNSKRSLLRDLMHPHRKHVHRVLGRYTQTELVIGSTSGTIGQDEQECLRDHHVTIWNAESQAGTYYKRICQQNRSVPSALAPTDEGYDPVITSEGDPLFKSIKEGYSVTIECIVNSKSTFEWSRTKPSDKIQEIDSTTRNNQFEIKENGFKNISMLTIKQMTTDYSGTYVCEATQAEGQYVQRFQYEIQTIVAPKITDIRVNNISIGKGCLLEFKESVFLTLSCETNGSPLPDVLWRRTSNKDDKVKFMNASMLVFPNLTRKYDGVYTCKAWNEAGVVNRTVNISVLHKPEITSSSDQDRRVGVGEQLAIFCKHTGNPRPVNTTWYKDGVPIHSNSMWMTEDSLLVTISSKTDYGDYTCEITNSQGKTSRTYAISGRPKMPTILSGNTSRKANEYHLRWKSNGHYVAHKYFIVRVIQVKKNVGSRLTNNNNSFSDGIEVQRIRVPVISSKKHFALRLQALRRQTWYKIFVTPYIEDDIAGDVGSITIQTPLEDYVLQASVATPTQPKAYAQIQTLPGNGVGLTLISNFLIPVILLMTMSIGFL